MPQLLFMAVAVPDTTIGMDTVWLSRIAVFPDHEKVCAFEIIEKAIRSVSVNIFLTSLVLSH